MTTLETPRRKPLRLDVSRTFIRRTDWSDANLDGADFSYADSENAIFRRVNFRNTILDGTNLKGADLTEARNLTRAQLDKAITDATTILPSDLRP